MDDASLAAALYEKSATPQPQTSSASNASAASILYDAIPGRNLQTNNAAELPASSATINVAHEDPQQSEVDLFQEDPQQAEQAAPAAEGDAGTAPDELNDTVEILIPDNIRAERAADPARSLYDQAAQFRETIDHSALFSNPAVAAQFEPEMQHAVVKELANMAADVGMNNSDVRTLRGVFGQVKETPSEETRLQWRELAVQRLNETYGMQAKQAMADAVQFVKADPRRVQMLGINGAGDHPDAVLLFARLARQARGQGKLK